MQKMKEVVIKVRVPEKDEKRIKRRLKEHLKRKMKIWNIVSSTSGILKVKKSADELEADIYENITRASSFTSL